jgi:hypothetical protein
VLVGAWVISAGLGLAFVFVKAPHPWGWEGFDNYRQLGLALARGEMYQTLEVPWGYPAFLAVCYRLFGDRQWIPLVVQVLLNSIVPLLIYSAVRARVGEREALVAAVWSLLSFNTVYAFFNVRSCAPRLCRRRSCFTRSGVRQPRNLHLQRRAYWRGNTGAAQSVVATALAAGARVAADAAPAVSDASGRVCRRGVPRHRAVDD